MYGEVRTRQRLSRRYGLAVGHKDVAKQLLGPLGVLAAIFGHVWVVYSQHPTQTAGMVTNREGDAAADTGCRRVGDSFDQKQPSRSACSVEERPSSSAVCSSAPRSLHLSGHAAAKPSAAQAASLCGGSDDSDVEDMDEDDGCMSDPDSG